MRWTFALVAAAGLFSTTTNHAQSPILARYRVHDTGRITTGDLARAARDGYRVVDNARVVQEFMVLERSNQTNEYLFSEGLQQDVREREVAPGYRILPQSVSVTVVSSFRHGPCTGILERSPGDRVARDYRVEHNWSLRNLQQDILEAASEGYRVLVVRSGAGFCAVLEREATRVGARAPTSDAKTARYELITERSVRPLERAMRKAVERGYRLHSVLVSDVDELICLMERRETGNPSYDYTVVSISWTTGRIEWKQLVDQMNQAAARGYSLHPLSIAAHRASRLHEVVAVMEKKESPVVEYGIVPKWASGLQFKENLVAVGEQGWDLVATIGSSAALFQRSPSPRAALPTVPWQSTAIGLPSALK